ncbi:hypothetical protein BV898_11307 [Hypsibius exemplaris]|uniref:Uncharacterized protein n=1 Tax=Hypsibius exemplaris TaxID=2072580 RepID=A0A1W0WGY7_HYPEX|nr:hypothetical protein BV898_11307 [Hypsibius exemplaris]
MNRISPNNNDGSHPCKRFLRSKPALLLTIFSLGLIVLGTMTTVGPGAGRKRSVILEDDKLVVLSAKDYRILKRKADAASGEGLVVPPFEIPKPFYLHYVRFQPGNGDMTMRFVDYLSVLSGVQYLKPDGILVHGDAEPQGTYWKDLLSRNLVRYVFRNKTTAAGQRMGTPKHVAFMEHAADISKLDVLLEYGGVVADFDVFFVRGERIKQILAKKRAITCYGDVDGNNIGLVAAHTDSKFLWAWRQSYRDIYVADWNFNQCMVSKYLSILYRDEVYVLDKVCNNPAPDQRLDDYFRGHGKIHWENSVAIHSYERHGRVAIASPKDLEGNLTTHKELLLTIYNNKQLPPPDLSFRDEIDPLASEPAATLLMS